VDLTLRTIAEDEVEAFLRTFRAVFGGVPDEQDIARARRRLEPDRSFVAVDGNGEIVATAGAHSFQMALPGGREVGAAGVTLVAVRADHRRRGVLTALMRRLLDQARERGEAVAALWASETPIYGRFGFGSAVPTVELTLDRAHAALAVPGPVDEVELVDTEVARAAFPGIRDEVLRVRAGMLRRPASFWDTLLDPGSSPSSGRRAPAVGAAAGPRVRALPARVGLDGRRADRHRAGPGTPRDGSCGLRPPCGASSPTSTSRRPPSPAGDRSTIRSWRWSSTRVAPVSLRLGAAGPRPRRRAAADRPALRHRRHAPPRGPRRLVPGSGGSVGAGRRGRTGQVCPDRTAGGPRPRSAGAVDRLPRRCADHAAGRRWPGEERVPGAASRLDRLMATPLAPWHEFMF
jgi:predicted N-acetyltransferase YhbS